MGWDTRTPDTPKRVIEELLGDNKHSDCAFRGEANARWAGLTCSFDLVCPANREHWQKLCEEWWIITAFRQRARNFLTLAEIPALETAIGALTVARHYGAPTRLLDWTSSPFVALYAACQSHQLSDGAEADGVIWRFSLNEFTKGRPIAWKEMDSKLSAAKIGSDWVNLFKDPSLAIGMVYPDYENPRMIAQQGFFTFGWEFGASHERLLEAVLPNDRRNKLIIKSSLKTELMHVLAGMNVTALALFPGLEGLAQSLRDVIRYHLRHGLDSEVMDALNPKR